MDFAVYLSRRYSMMTNLVPNQSTGLFLYWKDAQLGQRSSRLSNKTHYSRLVSYRGNFWGGSAWIWIKQVQLSALIFSPVSLRRPWWEIQQSAWNTGAILLRNVCFVCAKSPRLCAGKTFSRGESRRRTTPLTHSVHCFLCFVLLLLGESMRDATAHFYQQSDKHALTFCNTPQQRLYILHVTAAATRALLLWDAWPALLEILLFKSGRNQHTFVIDSQAYF